MKICILCNSVLALPAIHFFKTNGLAIEIGIPSVANGDTVEMLNFFEGLQVPVTKFEKQNLTNSLSRWINKHNADVVFVMTFPWKIPSQVLRLPKLGFFNFHYALLPKYKGASPVFWQLKNGEPYGGLTIHKMDEGWDTGPIAHIHKIAIPNGETFGMHNKRLAWESVHGVIAFLQKLMLLGNAIPLEPQQARDAVYYGRPGAKDISINWQAMTAIEIQRLVNACNPWNKGAYTKYQNNVFKIIQLSVKEQSIVYNHKLIPGTIINCSENKTMDVITVDNNVVSIEIISVDEGIFTADFLAKVGVKRGCILEIL